MESKWVKYALLGKTKFDPIYTAGALLRLVCLFRSRRVATMRPTTAMQPRALTTDITTTVSDAP